jgi:hypothetical protein
LTEVFEDQMDNTKVKVRSGAGPRECSEEAVATLVSELRTPVQTVALRAKLLQLGALTPEQSVGELVELVEGWSPRDTVPSSVAGVGPRRRVG